MRVYVYICACMYAYVCVYMRVCADYNYVYVNAQRKLFCNLLDLSYRFLHVCERERESEKGIIGR